MATTKYPNPPNDNTYNVPQDVPDTFYDGNTIIRHYNDGPTKITTTSVLYNCKTNKNSTCTGNECPWYGCPCPTNGPFLLEGKKFGGVNCSPFTNPDATKPDIINFEGPIPSVGGTVTAEQINALRDSILEEYGNRRWILEDPLRQNVVDFEETIGELLSAPNIDVLGNFIQYIIDRGDSAIQAEDYDFVGDLGYDNSVSGFNDTDGYVISTAPLAGDQVEATEIIELMTIVDNLRKACVCNDNCTCFGNCDCNWNCKCNY